MTAQKLKILFVDDNEDTLALALAAGGQAGVDVTVCSLGTTAVELAETNGFDAIILDLSMPVMDGITVAEEIRRNEEVRGEKSVLLAFYTAATVNPAVVRAIEKFDIRRVFGKPFDIFNIFSEVKRWTQKRCAK